jgi:hypothetical protein
MTCALIGDSIADMVRSHFADCYVSARSGAHVAEIIGRMRDADVVYLSAGSNDEDYSNLESNLRKLRAKASGRVVWIVPAASLARARHAVEVLASERGDRVVTFAARGIHPADPDALAKAMR